jgi:hypothetical protein
MGWLGISGGADRKMGKANRHQAARTTFSEWHGCEIRQKGGEALSCFGKVTPIAA